MGLRVRPVSFALAILVVKIGNFFVWWPIISKNPPNP